MSTFSVGGTSGALSGVFASATFQITEESFADKAGPLEELSCTILVPDPTTWGALFSLVTPREAMSVRIATSASGQSTVSIDVGAGAGVGKLDVSDAGLDSHDALLVELQSQAPVASGMRVARATFLLLDGAPSGPVGFI